MSKGTREHRCLNHSQHAQTSVPAAAHTHAHTDTLLLYNCVLGLQMACPCQQPSLCMPQALRSVSMCCRTFTRAVHAMHATRSPHVNPALDAAVPAPYYTCAAAGAAAAAGRGTASCCCVPAAAWSATVCAAASSQPSCSLTHIPVLCVSPPITLGSARGSW